MIITVPTLTENKTRRPALPEGVGFSLIEDHGDTMTVRTTEDVTDWAIENGYLIPTTVTMRQARLALNDEGKLEMVEDFINEIKDDKLRKDAQINWEYAQVVDRNDPLVQQLAKKFGATEEDINNFFRKAWTF